MSLTAALDPAKPKPLWARPEWQLIAFLWVCYVLNHADRQVVYTLFPALQEEFGYSDAVLGLTGALFLWVYGLFSPIAGILGDRWPKTGLVVGSLVVWSSFTILSGLSPNGGFLLVCRGLLGISESLFMPAAFGLMANAHGPESRSRAIAIFATSQMVGVALGGAISGYIAELLHWRVSFWLLGAAGVLFAVPLYAFFRTIPESFRSGGAAPAAAATAGLRSFFRLFRIPSLNVVATFAAVATFGLFLVYTWLPTFLFDKFALGLGRAGFEASVYPQAGTIVGLLAGGYLADRLYRYTRAARFWIVLAAFLFAAPSIYWIGAGSTLEGTRAAAIAFGFFAGFITANQAPSAFDVVPASIRASSVGILNLLGAAVSGFAPFLGGMARRTVGVDRVMAVTSVLYVCTGAVILTGILRYFQRDHERAIAQSSGGSAPAGN